MTNSQSLLTLTSAVQVWPEITLHIVPDAGHSSREPGIAKLLVEVRLPHFSGHVELLISVQATDAFANL